MNLSVIKRDGSCEPVSFDQITSNNADKSQSKANTDKRSKRYATEHENQQDDDDNSFNMTPEFQVGIEYLILSYLTFN